MLRSSFLFALLLASTAWSQTASITGRVTDVTGAVVPGASVAAQSVSTGVSSTSETNAEGYYNIRSVPPGEYNLTVEKSGFTTVRQTNLTLVVQQVARVDIALQVGAMAEKIEVNARAVMLDSETSALGQVVGSSQIANLPLLGRNAYALAGLVPGVRSSAGYASPEYTLPRYCMSRAEASFIIPWENTLIGEEHMKAIVHDAKLRYRAADCRRVRRGTRF
jgi:hypothetical protein